MANQDLIKKLLRNLESENGCPVQLKFETQTNEKDQILAGDFNKRKLTVYRINDINEVYSSALEILEGKYENLEDLRKKIRLNNFGYLGQRPVVLNLGERNIKKGINLIAIPSGIYDDKSIPGSIYKQDRIKIANLELELTK